MRFRLDFLVATLVFVLLLFSDASETAHADTATVVRPGDTLISIAQRHRVTVESIVLVNGLPSAERIFVGQKLRIPTDQRAPDLSVSQQGRGVAATSERPSAPTRIDAAASPLAAASAAMDGQHVVGAGENLFRIALRYGTTAAELARANGLASVDRIFVGQRLRVPGGGSNSGGAGTAGGAGAPPSSAPQASAPQGGSRVIVIDLSDQRLYAYQGYDLVQAFVVSTGSAQTPTPVGNFRVYNRLTSQDMYGPGYYAPGVPWVQYFTGAYAIHGTYWHNDFGAPVSHGCINMRTPEAAWLFDWAQQGTEVRVQY